MIGAWERFWFDAVPASTLAIVRIAFGLVVLAWGLSLAPDLAMLFGPDGLADGRRSHVAVYVLLLAGAGCMVAGYRTRIASAVVFAALLWFDHVNPWALNSGDAVLRHVAFVLMLAPCGAALSLDRRRSRVPPDRVARVGAWSLRLLQLQLSAIYLAAVVEKLHGDAWRDGIAASLALSVPDAARFPVDDLLTTSPVAAHVLTWGTIALELAIAVLVWNHRLRPWVLGAGVCFHVAIEYSLRTGFLSWAMLVCYVAFLPPDTAQRLVGCLGERLRALRAGPVAAVAQRPRGAVLRCERPGGRAEPAALPAARSAPTGSFRSSTWHSVSRSAPPARAGDGRGGRPSDAACRWQASAVSSQRSRTSRPNRRAGSTAGPAARPLVVSADRSQQVGVVVPASVDHPAGASVPPRRCTMNASLLHTPAPVTFPRMPLGSNTLSVAFGQRTYGASAVP